MYCKKCGQQLPDNTKFCSRCGTKQSVPPTAEAAAPNPLPKPVSDRICPQCGAPLKLNGNFCGKCGAKIATLNNIPAHREIKTERTPAMAQPDTPASAKPENKPQATVQPPPPPAGKTTASCGGSTWVIPLLSCLLCLSLGLSGGFFLWQQLNGGEKENPVQPDYNSMIPPSSVTPSAGAEPSPQPAQDVSTPAQSNVLPEPETTAPEASDLPQQAEQPVAESERYRWDSETITNEMLKNMDRESIMWIRNEIYARHGYQFVRDDIQAHFEAKDWYVPNPTYSDSLLNQTERKNIDTIVLYEKAQGWRK